MKEEMRKNLIINAKTISIDDLCFIANKESDIMNIIFKNVSIPNDYCMIDEWRIIGINHDGTNNTIDLISDISAIEPMVFDNESNIYEDSSIRKYLNNDFYNGFDNNVKNMMKEMEVISNNKILKDKVKLLSMTELGLEDYDKNICKNEGNPYPVSIHMIKIKDNEYITHMTRSRGPGSLGVWQIYYDGGIYIGGCKFGRDAAPVIRLGL